MTKLSRWIGSGWLPLVMSGALWSGSLSAQTAASSAVKPSPGLQLTYSLDSKATDTTTVPNIWLYVAAGQSPTPFLPSGPFSAVWEGHIAVDLRGEYAFRAEVNGTLKLEINGEAVLQATGSGTAWSEPGKTVRLNKGNNLLKATFSSPQKGDALVRLEWIPKESFSHPIPQAALTHPVSDNQKKADQLRLGRELVLEHRCLKCHTDSKNSASAVPELSMDAPNLETIGNRRNYEWMAKWILDPKAQRARVHMPRVLHGATAKEDAQAMAAYLASLGASTAAAKDPEAALVEAGKKHFETLHCAACHNAPGAAETDPKKVSLTQVQEKFAPGALVVFLEKPDQHYAWIRMPRFKLTEQQREELAAYLLANAIQAKPAAAPTDKAILEKGQKLVQSSGCINCHSVKLDNQFATKPFEQVAAGRDGCLATVHAETGKAPFFGFTPEESKAIQVFLATDRAGLNRHVPVEFAERQIRSLSCYDCHGQFEGFPHLDILGGKLKPEWSRQFIAGNITNKPRPWLESQMPGFGKRAEFLAPAMAMQHGLPPKTPADESVEGEKAKTGQRLVSAPPLGFACVSCHSVGTFGATEVFEAPGINLATSGDRLQRSFYERWLRNPTLIDPLTKMPVYFDDEGKSPFTEVYEGDAHKQIQSIWHYVLMGEKMPAPKPAE